MTSTVLSYSHPTIDQIISYMEGTTEESWCMDVVKTKDGRNCFYVHLFDLGGGDNGGSGLMNLFEKVFATTYMLYPVNDGEDPNYPQSTPKQRVLAYLRDLRDGKAKTTQDLWAEEAAAYNKRQASP